MGINLAEITAYGTIILNPKRSLSQLLQIFMDSEYGKYFEMDTNMSDDKRYSVFVYLKSTETYKRIERDKECQMSWNDYEEEIDRIDKPDPNLSPEEQKAMEYLGSYFTLEEPFFWVKYFYVSR